MAILVSYPVSYAKIQREWNSGGLKVLNEFDGKARRPETPRVSPSFMVASTILSASYGSSFLLVDLAMQINQSVSVVGQAISMGTITTIGTSLIAGRFASMVGLLVTIRISALVLAITMVCFWYFSQSTASIFVGGAMLGIGWALFYIVAPLQIISFRLGPHKIRYLTFLSASQMLGIGMAVPLGSGLASLFGSFSTVFVFFALACVTALALFMSPGLDAGRRSTASDAAEALTLWRSINIASTAAVFPIAMITINACIFAGLSTFQTVYAAELNQSKDIFFATFSITVVVLRFLIAPYLEKLSLVALAGILLVLVGLSLAIFASFNGSLGAYFLASALFAAGYGLSYTVLYGILLNVAVQGRLSISVCSQLFTIAYFIGIFGSPYLSGLIVQELGFSKLLLAMLVLVAMNALLLFFFAASRKN